MECLKGKYDNTIYSTVPTVVAPPRNMPHKLKEKVLEELYRIETL